MALRTLRCVRSLGAVPLTVKLPLGFPHLVQLPLFAMIFGGSGYVRARAKDVDTQLIPVGCYSYMIHAGDPLNGAGTTTGKAEEVRDGCLKGTANVFLAFLPAWSLTYLFLHGKKAFVSRRPAPILLSSAMAANVVLYGVEYFVNS